MLADAAAAETRTFVAIPDRVPEIDSWIEEVGSAWRLGEDVVFRARVCVAEILANLLEHGRARSDGDDVRISLRPSPPALELEISDSGRPFDPTARAAAAAAARASAAPGGHGLRLVGAYASAMTYRRAGERNILSLRVAPGPGTPA